MPSTERTVISLYYHEELTCVKYAKIVNLHESRVSQLKSQAILGCAPTCRSGGQSRKGALAWRIKSCGAPAWLIEEFAASFHPGHGIDGGGGAARRPWPPTNSPSEELETGPEKLLWWEQTYSLGPDSQIWIGAAKRRAGEEIGKPDTEERRESKTATRKASVAPILRS